MMKNKKTIKITIKIIIFLTTIPIPKEFTQFTITQLNATLTLIYKFYLIMMD